VPQPVPVPVPLENRILALTWAFSGLGGLLVFVDQAAQDRFSADLARAGVGCGDAGSRVRAGDAQAICMMMASGARSGQHDFDIRSGGAKAHERVGARSQVRGHKWAAWAP
jgi:hypothetical protein